MTALKNSTINHFVTYHNVEKRGRFSPSEQGVNFLSNKSLTVLGSTIGHKVWMIRGEKGAGGKNVYRLLGFYIVDEIRECADPDFEYSIAGKQVDLLKEPVSLNDYEWFSQLFSSVGRFAFGLSQIKDVKIITALEELTK